MENVIIYLQDDGTPAVVIPTPECLCERSIMEIALKDVPAGKPFKIISASELPEGYPQEVWDVSEADLTDGIGSPSNRFES